MIQYMPKCCIMSNGWPKSNSGPDFKSFYARRNELSTEEGCLLWGNRVVVPPAGQQRVLQELHEAHPGISTMKGIARSYVWWPNLDKDIESRVESCEICQVNRNKPCVAPLHVWPYPDKPWDRVHIDFAGPFMGNMFLVLIDAYSKWLEVRIMNSTTALATIAELRDIFTTHGLPRMLVSDNGCQFISYEFSQFMQRNGIQHVTCAPFRLSPNGMAERAVQTFKNGLKKMRKADIKTKLSRFLFRYRCSPQTVTEMTPAKLLMGRNLQGPLDLMRPDFKKNVEKKQQNQKKYHDKGKTLREFVKNDEVYVENYSGRGNRWLPGVVVEVTGPLSYKIEISDNRVVRRHVDQIRDRRRPIEETESVVPTLEWGVDVSEDRLKEVEHAQVQLNTKLDVMPSSSNRLLKEHIREEEKVESDIVSPEPVELHTSKDEYVSSSPCVSQRVAPFRKLLDLEEL